jgi:Arc/MetJ-type ribon-helix-helix transcriptional regulator
MKKLKVTLKKRHRRPATGRDLHVTSRMPPGLIAEVDAWATGNGATRSEAIRRLVELGLTTRTKSKQGSAARAERAKELASKTIDNLTAATPESDEKASRKGNLIRGPEEFRQVRVDRPKPKKG